MRLGALLLWLVLAGCVEELPSSAVASGSADVKTGDADTSGDAQLPGDATADTQPACSGTGPCDDGDPCTTADKCAAGKCSGQPLYREPIYLTTPDEQQFSAGVHQPDGSLVLTEVLKIAGGISSRLMGFGGVVDGMDVKLQALTQEWANSIAQDGSGWALSGSALGQDLDVLFVRVGAAGVVQAETKLDLGGDEEAFGIRKVGNNFAIFGYREVPSGAFLIFVDGQGVCKKGCTDGFYTAGEGAVANSANTMEILSDGSYLLAGEGVPKAGFGGVDGVIWRVSAEGKLLDYKLYGGPGTDRFWAVVAKPGGGHVLVGKRGDKGWVVGIDAAGKVEWESLLPGAQDVAGIRPAPYGWVAAAEVSGGQKLWGLDPIGSALWQRTVLGRPYALLEEPGGYAVVGDLQGDAKVLYIDHWGYATCEEAGKCKGIATCDDGKACTDDTCDESKGCIHANAIDGQPCLGEAPCQATASCSAATCKAGTVTTCDDKNPCTADTCDNSKGCVHAISAGPCDDGDASTSADSCTAGLCLGSKN